MKLIIKITIGITLLINSNELFAQFGIGTSSPVSTLDVRGSASFNTRSISTSTATLTSTDHTINYSGTSTSTLTLPSATGCSGREIWIKNSSSYAVTIATASSQTIDGNSSWSIPNQYETVLFMSDGSNWMVKQQITPNNGNSDWKQGGNTQTALKNLGTMGAYDLPFITNNAERMRVLSSGNVGIATTTPGSTLDVKGTLRLSGSTSGYVGLKGAAAAGSTTYTFPSTDGTNGQVVSTNGSGTLSWITPPGYTTSHSMSSSGNTITSTYNSVTGTAPAINSVSNTSLANTLSTTVNGVLGSGVNLVNSLSNTSSANNLSTTVNGVASTNVTLINSNTLSSSSNTLTSNTNGVSATANAINSVSNTSSGNTLTTSINGVAGTGVNIINSNTLAAGSSAISSTINGVVATLTPASGTIASSTYLGFDASGNLVKNAVPTTSNSLTSSANSVTSLVNSTSSSANAINSVVNTSSANTLSTAVNGVSTSSVNKIFSNTFTLSGTSVTSTVNGIAASALDLKSIDSSIYKTDGPVRSNRTITMADKNLTLSSTTGNLIFNPSSIGRVGIATTIPNNTLDVYATSNPLRIEGLQTSTSSSDNVIAATSTGALNKATLGASYYVGNLTTDFSITTTNTIYKMTATNESLDLGSEYNSSTGLFTPNVSGVYVYEIEITASGSSATNNDYGSTTNNDRNVMGFVSNSTGQWIGRFNYELTTSNRSYYCKGVVSLTAGSSYYFGSAVISSTTLTAYPSTGCNGTRF
ncbi:MAG: hypothetical protein RIQ33_362, partial [Bacteroidota bacterium]